MAIVYGRDKSLLTLPADMAGKRGPEAVSKFRRALDRSTRRELTEAERDLQYALLANRYRPSHPDYRMFGGYVTYVGKVKHLSVSDMIDRPVVKAVEQEMARRGLGELWGTRLADELIETAKASLIAKVDPPVEASTPQEAARLVVQRAIDAGGRAGASEGERMAYAVSRGW